MMRPDVVPQNRHIVNCRCNTNFGQLNTHKANVFSAAVSSVEKLCNTGSLLQRYDSGFVAKINNQKDLEAGF